MTRRGAWVLPPLRGAFHPGACFALLRGGKRRGDRTGRWGDLAELVRAPAALSVPGDLLAGAAAARWPFGWRTAGMIAASVCLYWAGMALNDYADRDLDAVERPERPIPSGRVSPGQALALAAGLTAAGVGIAGVAGRRSGLAVAVPLAATVWAYDFALKSTVAGPAAMALARGLNVTMGSGLDGAGAAALVVGAHTYTVTALSRHEVHGGTRSVPVATLAGSTAVGVASTLFGREAPRTHRIAGAAAAAGYLAAYGGAQATAIRQPTAGNIRAAVGAGILGLLPLQAALTATSGSLVAALSLVVGHPLARRLARKVSPT
jgi:UbiA prenyltransferase family